MAGYEIKHSLKQRELMHNMTITVTIKNDWRVYLGLWLVKLGCWVSNIGYREIKE